MRTVLIGLDSFDPGTFERLYEAGRLPNLGKYADAGGYAQFSVSNPPQSEVSWTSIATGANPGEHGIFDFVQRDPANYGLYVSLLPTKTDRLGTQFRPPYTTATIFDQAVREGYPATALWWPARFPARFESPVRTIPGLGTPDIQGRLGVGTLFATDPGLKDGGFKTAIELLKRQGNDRYRGELPGPALKRFGGSQQAVLELQLEVSGERTARLSLGKQIIELVKGEWSPVIELSFRAGLLFSLRAITRVILTETEPEPRLYFLPLQIHPMNAPWKYAAPPRFIRETWEKAGPFLTLGWPQDTTGLEEGWIDDSQFIELCRSIDEERERIFFHHLGGFREGLFAIVSDTLDRVQHMFWRDRPEVVEAWYIRLDALVGRAEELLQRHQASARILIVSDHGFADFDYKVHLNHWLEANGFLRLMEGAEQRTLRLADWPQTQAYAAGLNSLYLNLEGREAQGSVAAGEQEGLKRKLRDELLAWRGPDGRPVVQKVYLQEEAFEGTYAKLCPDLVLGYAPGYRASAQTGLGNWEEASIEANRDHWGADHCIDPQAVPGVLFSNLGLDDCPRPSYRDIPALATGMEIDRDLSASPALPGGYEDQEAIEERLKGLGYL